MLDCRENPVPNSKFDWVVENVGFGRFDDRRL